MDYEDSDISNSDLDSDSDVEQDNGQVEATQDWGSSKRNYYFTDYVDQDFPTKLDDKHAKQAEEEEKEALIIQKRLLSTIDSETICGVVAKDEQRTNESLVNILSRIQQKNCERNKKNRANQEQLNKKNEQPEAKKVTFSKDIKAKEPESAEAADRQLKRPIDKAMEKNRGLTPYRKKAYRNPRVRHRNKFKKAAIKRRHIVQEAQKEWSRYSGEMTGIKTSTVRSIKFS